MDSFEEESNLTIAAYIKRNDPRDALVLNKKSLNDNIWIGSSSKRRELQFKAHLKKQNIKTLGGKYRHKNFQS